MKKFVLTIMLFIYLVVLFKITVFRSNFCITHLFVNGKLNLLPFIELKEIFEKQGLWQFIYLFIGNIIWFTPFGYLLPLIADKKINMFTMALYGLSLSLLIESLQFIFGTGISEVDDLILNTLGAIIGFVLYITICSKPNPQKRYTNIKA